MSSVPSHLGFPDTTGQPMTILSLLLSIMETLIPLWTVTTRIVGFNVILPQFKITWIGSLNWRIVLIALIDMGRPAYPDCGQHFEATAQIEGCLEGRTSHPLFAWPSPCCWAALLLLTSLVPAEPLSPNLHPWPGTRASLGTFWTCNTRLGLVRHLLWGLSALPVEAPNLKDQVT